MNLSELIAPSFYAVHYAVTEPEYVHFWLEGGRGSGKSSFVSIEILLGLLRDKNANAVILRKNANTLRGSVFEQILWAADVLGIGKYISVFPSLMEIKLPEGQRIIFKGANEPEKLKSIKFRQGYCKYIWYEELTEFAQTDVRKCNQTLMRGGNDGCKAFYTYNPPKERENWVNQESLINTREDTLIHRSTYSSVPRHWLGEQFFIEAEYLKSAKPMEYRHEYLGEVTGNGGTVFNNVELREISDDEVNCFEYTYYGLDFGYAVDPLHFAACAYEKKKKKLYIFYEIHKVGMRNREAVEAIKSFLAGEKRKAITADSSEPRTIAEFADMGLDVRRAKKGADSVSFGVKFLQDIDEIIIDPIRCPNTAREFVSYELERDANGNCKAGFKDRDNHSIDAVRYALEAMMRENNIQIWKY